MLIIDSNALLWMLRSDRRITPVVRRRIEREREVAVSFATPWELWVKIKARRLPPPPDDIEDALKERRITILPITLDDARRAAELPLLHGDPFDRMIIAQALARGAPVLTSDESFAAYGVTVVAL